MEVGVRFHPLQLAHPMGGLAKRMLAGRFKPMQVVRSLLISGALLFIAQVLRDYNLFPFQQRVFAGHYVGSFETSAFYPCEQVTNPKENLGYVGGYWLQIERSVAKEIAQQVRPFAVNVQGYDVIEVHVRFVGYLAEPVNSIIPPPWPYHEGYGHRGMYPNQVTLVKLLSVNLDNPTTRQANQLLRLSIALVVGLGLAVSCRHLSQRTPKNLIMKALQLLLVFSIGFAQSLWAINFLNLSCG